MTDDWLEDTTDVLHCSMPPQVRAHIEELRDEVARLRAAEVPLSANVGFAYMDDGVFIKGENRHGDPYVTAREATEAAAGEHDVPVALIPVSAWDRT